MQRRRELGQPADVEAAGIVDLFAVNDRDGDRHVLRGFAAPPRGDDDLAAVASAFDLRSVIGGGGVVGSFQCGGGVRGDRQGEGKREEAGRKAPADRRIFCGHDNFLLQENCHIRWSGLRHEVGNIPVGSSWSLKPTSVGVAVPLGHIDLHQSSFVHGQLDRAELQLVEGIEHGLDGAGHLFGAVFGDVPDSAHDHSFPFWIRRQSICQVI